jgi:hypothetical protein
MTGYVSSVARFFVVLPRLCSQKIKLAFLSTPSKPPRYTYLSGIYISPLGNTGCKNLPKGVLLELILSRAVKGRKSAKDLELFGGATLIPLG